MRWHKDSITQGEIDALHKAAQRAWADDTRYPVASGSGDVGQCYVTAYWLKQRLGGHVGRVNGHYAWLSPEGDYVLDLAPHSGDIVYEKNINFTPTASIPNARTERFARRADAIFEHLSKVLHLSLDYAGDALPAEEPERATEIAQEQPYWHAEPSWQPAQGRYQFVYANGSLEVSPFHQHEQLLAHTGVDKNYSGPMAMGHVTINDNKATWEAASNMNLKGLDRIFKDYTKHVGWDWGGLTNQEGEPISDEFKPTASGKQFHFLYDPRDDHLWIVPNIFARLSSADFDDRSATEIEGMGTGILFIAGQQAHVLHSRQIGAAAVRALTDFSDDRGLTLYLSGNDNVLKTIPDLELHNNADPNPTQPEEHPYPGAPQDEREPSGIYKCPVCNRLFPGWSEYAVHRRQEAEDAGSALEESGGFPENDMDATFPTHFTEQQPVGVTTGSRRVGDGFAVSAVHRAEAERVDGFLDSEHREGDQYFVCYSEGSPIGYSRLRDGKLGVTFARSTIAKNHLVAKVVRYSEKQPKDLLPAPVPFIYDIHDDEINVGEPGQRTSDIHGQFTPGGIVEGIYEPGGKVVIRTQTNTPYSVRHVIDLWYYQHPELSVTSMYIQNAEGKMQKLAAENIGGYVQSMAAADPAVYEAQQALEQAGGEVYAVGGAVRDAVLGNEPKDIDLMVTGLKPAEVHAALEALPGSSNLTGKDFGVFRYKNGGDDVEIALPRRERSTGAGHRDFNVQADPHMRPEEDLWRRDFTANAMAVNLRNGRLVDPYNGADDIRSGVLRSHNPDSLGEDPLRVVRALVANARHGLVPDTATREQMERAAPSLTHLPQERIQAELDKLFGAKDPAAGIRLAHETGALKHFLPEVDEAFGYDQNNPHHEYELGQHLTNVLERTAEKSSDPDVRLAGLLHDIGKPGSQWTDPETGSSHFYKKRLPDGSFIGDNHEELGSRMTSALMNRLRYPNDRTKRVTDLVRHHMFPAFTSEKGARKFMNRVGDHADDLLNLRWADQGGKSEYPSNSNTGLDLSVDKQRNLLEQVRNQQQPVNQSQLAVNGHDLIQAGIPAGPQLGALLQRLTDAVVENPELNTRDQLLNLAQNVPSTEKAES